MVRTPLRSSQGEDYFTLREIGSEEGDTCGVCSVFQLSKDLLNVHKRKWKLSLRDATESVYIGGLCNRLLLVFGTLSLGIVGGGGRDIFV